MVENFKVLVVNNEQGFTVDVKNLSIKDLPEGDVLLKVAYSSINFKKDSLATIPDGNIVKSYPFVPGNDLAGTVISLENPHQTRYYILF